LGHPVDGTSRYTDPSIKPTTRDHPGFLEMQAAKQVSYKQFLNLLTSTSHSYVVEF